MSELKKARVNGEQTEVVVSGHSIIHVAPVSLAASPSKKTRPCKMFFSPSGCRFWSKCNYLHTAPAGTNPALQEAVAGGYAQGNSGGGGGRSGTGNNNQRAPVVMAPPYNPYAAGPHMAMAGPPMGMGMGMGMRPPPAMSGGAMPLTVTRRKTKLCKNFGTAAGCQFNERCTFAHGDGELQGAAGTAAGGGVAGGGTKRSHDSMVGGHVGYSGWLGEAGFQVVAMSPAGCTLAVRGDAMGTVIGKGGMNVRHIMTTTGCRVKVADQDDPATNTRSVEIHGAYEQCQAAQYMIQTILAQFMANAAAGGSISVATRPAGPPSNIKTRLCEHFARGQCQYGERCHFAHGEAELRK